MPIRCWCIASITTFTFLTSSMTVTSACDAPTAQFTDLQASLVIGTLMFLPDQVPGVRLKFRNVSHQAISFNLATPTFFVARDRVVIQMDEKRHPNAPNCSQRMSLQPGQEKYVLCGIQVSDDSYAVLAEMNLHSLGYDLGGFQGHYTVYALVPLTDIERPQSVTTKTPDLCVQSAPIEFDLPYKPPESARR